MWWFLVITLGSSIVPAYVMPQGPFANEQACQAIRQEVERTLREQSRPHSLTACWRDR